MKDFMTNVLVLGLLIGIVFIGAKAFQQHLDLQAVEAAYEQNLATVLTRARVAEENAAIAQRNEQSTLREYVGCKAKLEKALMAQRKTEATLRVVKRGKDLVSAVSRAIARQRHKAKKPRPRMLSSNKETRDPARKL